MADAMSITRRRFLKVVPPTAVIATAALVSGADAGPMPELQHWLDTADPFLVADYYAARLAEVLGKMDATRAYHHSIDYKNGFCLVAGDPVASRIAPVAKVYIDDGSPLLADDVTGTTAYADWERNRA